MSDEQGGTIAVGMKNAAPSAPGSRPTRRPWKVTNKKSAAPQMLKSHTSSVATEARFESASVATMARRPVTRSP